MKSITKHKDLFQSIFEASVEGIIVINDDGYILLTNPACEQLFGYATGELTGKNIDILIPKKLKREYKIHLKKQTTPSKRETDIWGVKKGGGKFSLNISLSHTVIDGKNTSIVFLWDATQHKKDLKTIEKTNAELIESNRKFDVLINNQKGILFRCKNNRNFDMNFISEGCLEITGYTNEDFKNHKIAFGQLILNQDRDYVWECIQSAIKQKKQYDFEYRIQHNDGSIKYVWEKGEAIYNNQNEVIALEGFISDITTQKETELELRSSEAKTKALLKAIPDIMFIQDRKGVHLDWYANNPEESSISPEKLIGVNMKKLIPPHVYPKIKSSHKKAVQTGKTQLTEYSIQGKKGIEYREARVVRMHDHSILTIIRDITEKKAINTELNIRNNALASASNGIVIVDAQQPHLPIIYCNEAFEKMTGYSKEEILGRNNKFLQNDDRDQKEIGIMKNAIANGQPCNVTVRNYKRDGTLFWNDVNITPIYNKRGKLTHFIGVQHNVTTKVKEEKLKDRTRKILELIAQNKPIENIGNTIVQTIENYLEDCTASILLLSNQDKSLYELAGPNLPKEFSEYFEGIALGPQAGSCGTASFLKKEVIVSNIETDMLWKDHKEAALNNGIKACWSFPIMTSTDEVLGTFNIFSPYPRKPLKTEEAIILDFTHLASIAIENHSNIITVNENKGELERYAKKLEEKVRERTQEVMATVQKLVETNLDLEDQLLITEQAEANAMASKVLISKIAKYFPKGIIVVINRDLKIKFVEGEALDQLGIRQKLYEGQLFDDLTIFSKPRKALIKKIF